MVSRVGYFLKTFPKIDSIIANFGMKKPAFSQFLLHFSQENAIPPETPATNDDSKQKIKEKPKKKPLVMPEPSPEEFAKLDIRVGKITECWKHPESEKLYCEKINIGDEVRDIASGLQQFVPLEEMTQDLVIVLTNLKPRKLAGFYSNGMILCASSADGTKVEILRPHPDSQVGERVILEGFDKITQEKQASIDPQKNLILTALFPHFKTDQERRASFMNFKLKTSAGYITAKTLTDSNIN